MSDANPGAAADFSAQPQATTAHPGSGSWSRKQRVAFRLLFTVGGGLVVLVIYSNVGLAPLLRVTGIQWVLSQIGSYLTRGTSVVIGAGGDQAWQWCMLLGWTVVAVLITALWSTLDTTPSNYRSLAGLLHVFTRFGLALTMIVYGLAKVLPTQMGYMALPAYQLQLHGDTTLFNTLWGFMGASNPYTIATGLLELISGLLLLWRRTWLLGAALAVIATTQVLLRLARGLRWSHRRRDGRDERIPRLPAHRDTQAVTADRAPQTMKMT